MKSGVPRAGLKLHGFNNLTKTLSFNIYDVSYASSASHRAEYIEYIDEVYNAERLTQILTEVAEIIGASVLDLSRQDYEPQGASVTMLISEEPVVSGGAVQRRATRPFAREHRWTPGQEPYNGPHLSRVSPGPWD